MSRSIKLTVIAMLISLSAMSQRVPNDAQKVYMKFENSREQYGVKVDTSFYFVRYGRLVVVKKKIVSYRLIKK